MTELNSYLHFNGNCEEAFNLYKSVFGGEFAMLSRLKDVPAGVPCPPGDPNHILHVSLPIGPHSMLMGSDVPDSVPKAVSGSNYSISVNVDSEEEANKTFNGLSAGGKVIMPLEKAFWGALFGMCTDKFGVFWMVNHDYQKK
ncbi:MAG: VOC family protein [Chitinophagaceae bacterium]|nr:VOC family protein [Chitinophagaceae bacterium]